MSRTLLLLAAMTLPIPHGLGQDPAVQDPAAQSSAVQDRAARDRPAAPGGRDEARQIVERAIEDRAEQPADPLFFPGRPLAREVFAYEHGGRRDPFAPAMRGVAPPAPVEEDDVAGIIHHARSDLSVALLRTRWRGGAHRAVDSAGAHATPTRLRLGDIVAGQRVVEICADRVVLEMDTEAGPVQRVLRIRSADPRGGP